MGMNENEQAKKEAREHSGIPSKERQLAFDKVAIALHREQRQHTLEVFLRYSCAPAQYVKVNA
jgi:hypothetical protein